MAFRRGAAGGHGRRAARWKSMYDGYIGTMIKWDPALRANQEFQSALVRMGFWVFGVIYVGSAAYTGYYQVDWVYFFPLFGVYFLFFTGMLISVLIRPEWTAASTWDSS